MREHLAQSLSSGSSNAVLYLHRLGAALLRRFWNLRHEDDLYEAIWVLYDALEALKSDMFLNSTYRTLEICLDLSTALFFRYQLLQLSNDLDSLRMVLVKQIALLGKSELGWIWAQSGPEGSPEMVLYRSSFFSRTMAIGQAVSEVNRHKKYYMDHADFHVLVRGLARRGDYSLTFLLFR